MAKAERRAPAPNAASKPIAVDEIRKKIPTADPSKRDIEAITPTIPAQKTYPSITPHSFKNICL